MNIVMDEAVEEKSGGEKVRLGMVVCVDFFSLVIYAFCNMNYVDRVAIFVAIFCLLGHSRKLRRYARGLFPSFTFSRNTGQANS